MFLANIRRRVAVVALCLIFVQGGAHQAQQFGSTPSVAQASRAQTAPVRTAESWMTRLAPDRGRPVSTGDGGPKLHREDQPDVRRLALSTRSFSFTRP